jgi:molecular chaperone DnaK
MVMQEAKLKWDKIDKVLLAGGMTRMPMIRAMMSSFASVPLVDQLNPDEVVARGAAIQGILSILAEENVSGARVVDADVRRRFSGLDGGLIEVTDITSHTLGVVLWDEKHLNEYVFPMIRKMTPIPAKMKNSFGTADANMQHAIVKVVEGESTVPAECTPLGVCDIKLPPYLPKGSPVQLTYQYNGNQVLEVQVEAAGNSAQVTIDRNTGLDPKDIDKATTGLDELHVT